MSFLNKCKLAAVSACLLFSQNALAKDAEIGPVFLDSVTVFNVAGFGHKAGNIEIKIEGGIPNHHGTVCDNKYITTDNTGVGYEGMLSVLLAAHASKSPLFLGISDTNKVLGDRCRLIYAQILHLHRRDEC